MNRERAPFDGRILTAFAELFLESRTGHCSVGDCELASQMRSSEHAKREYFGRGVKVGPRHDRPVENVGCVTASIVLQLSCDTKSEAEAPRNCRP